MQSRSCWGPPGGRACTSELPPSQEHPALFGEGFPWAVTSDIPALRPQAQLPKNTLGQSCSNRRTWRQARCPQAICSHSFHCAGGWGSPGTQHICRCPAGTTSQRGRHTNRHYTVTTPSRALPQDKSGLMNQVSGSQ